MQEETKEEFLARRRKELGVNGPDDDASEEELKKPSLKSRLKSLLFLLLFALFLWTILQIFGMLKSN